MSVLRVALLLFLALPAAGCAAVSQSPPPDRVRTIDVPPPKPVAVRSFWI